MSKPSEYRDYGFYKPEASHMHRHFMPHVFALAGDLRQNLRVLDVGCGNGFTCGAFLSEGCEVVGVDLSKSGIQVARSHYPTAKFELVSADDDLLSKLDEPPFDLVISTEVVEHLYSPREYARSCFAALKPGGRFICTTPYHGYFKNLILGILGKWDQHADPLWDGGHIKLWSRATLTTLLKESGFENIQFRGAGRFPGLWMTMVMSGNKPLIKLEDNSNIRSATSKT